MTPKEVEEAADLVKARRELHDAGVRGDKCWVNIDFTQVDRTTSVEVPASMAVKVIVDLIEHIDARLKELGVQ